MLSFIMINFIIKHTTAQTGTINPTLQIQYSEYQISDWNNSLYFTIESKYVPASGFYENKSVSNNNNQYIFCIQSNRISHPSTSYVFLTYLKIDNQLKTLTHFFEFQTQLQIYKEKVELQNLNYEGFWYCLELKNNVIQKSLNITFYQNLNKLILFQKILKNDYLSIQDHFSFYLGDSKISRYLGLNQLQGLIKCQLISSNSKFTTLAQPSCSSNSGIALRKIINYSSYKYFNQTIKDLISKSYGLTTWIKIEENQNMNTNYVNVLHIQQHTVYNDQTQQRRKLVQVSYSITSTKQFIEISYTTFTFPSFSSIIDNINSFEKQVIYEIPIKYSLYNWHYFSFSFRSNSIYVNINFVQLKYQFAQTLNNINQFSDLILIISLGGTENNKSNNNGQFNSPQFYSCLTTFSPLCYFTCSTCFGPNQNQCLTCHTTSNRYLTVDNNCICKSGYLDLNVASCFAFTVTSTYETLISLSKKKGYDQVDPILICSFGYFQFDNECFQCPKLNNMYFCPECIQFPNSWVQTPICTKQYSQFNQNENNTFIQDIENDINIINQHLDLYDVYLFSDNQLQFCSYCSSLCLTLPYSSQCRNSSYYHFNQPVMVICIQGAYLINGECKFCSPNCSKCNLIDNELQCITPKQLLTQNQACYPTPNNGCKSCHNNSLYFLNFEQNDCYICSIPYCKYCFQYLKSNPEYNSVFNYQPILYLQEDLAIGCALCYKGYIFNFFSGLCEQNQNLLSNSCSLYYISDEQTPVCITDNDFSQGIQVDVCQNYLQNCLKCIKITNNQYYCLRCEDGYYLHRTYGSCLSCQDYDPTFYRCYSIQLYDQNFKYEMTPLLFSLNKQYPGSQNVEKLLIYVKQCVPGYDIITNQNCSLVDNSYCSFYSNGCRTCLSTLEGTKRLTILNLKCSDCPYYCEYCKPRNEFEIQQLNPYLNLSIIQPQLTYRCIQKSNTYNDIFFDNEYQLSRQCTQDIPKCQLQIFYNFSTFNTFQSTIKQIFNNQISYYNLKSPTQITIFINSTKTYLFENSFYYFTIIQNIFIQTIVSLKYTKLSYYSQDIQFAFIFSQFKLVHFQEILFNQTTILFSLIQQSVFFIESQLQVKLTFENVIISDTQIKPNYFGIQYDTKSKARSYQIAVQNPNQINFTNVIIQNISLINVNFFNLTSVVEKVQNLDFLHFKNVTFLNCSFYSTNLIILSEKNKYDSIQFTDIRLINCIFDNSSFFSNIGLYLHGNVQFQDFIIQNCTIINSVYIQAPDSHKTLILNFTISNCSIQNSDLIALASSSTIIHFQLFNSIMQNVILIHKIKTSQSVISGTNDIHYLKNIKIYDCQYQQTYILKIPQYGIEKISVSLQDIKLFQMKSLDIVGHRQYYFFTISALFFKAYNIQLIRSSGCQDFSIINAYSVNISKLNVTSSLKQYQFNFDKIKDNSLNSILYIQAQIVELKDIFVQNQLSVDVKLFELNLIQIQLNKQIFITLHNIVFQNIQLIKSIFFDISTILYITSILPNNITISNSIFQRIFLTELVQDTKVSSASLAVISSQFSYARFINNIINDAIALNTSNSVLFIQIFNLEIVNLTSKNINNFQYYYDNYRIEQLVQFDYESTPIINSFGGLINLQIQYLLVLNSYFLNSTGLQGGSLSITTKYNSLINIQNCTFINQSTSLNNASNGKGGSIFINSENSYLNLQIKDTNFINSKSGFIGGVIYIKPTVYQVIIFLNNILFKNVYAIQSSVFSFQMNKLNAKSISQISITKIKIENSFDEFLQYLSQFNQEINNEKINQDSAVFSLKNCQVLLDNFEYYGFAFQPIIYLKFVNRIIINNVILQNLTHISSKLIYFENVQDFKSTILIKMLQIKDSQIQEFQQQPPQKFISYLNNLKNYLQTLIQESYQNSLIQINLYKNISSVHVMQLYLINNNCTICNYGVFNLNNYQSQRNLQLQGFIFISNFCGLDSCFLAKSINQLTYIILSTSKFINNKAQSGGAFKSDNYGFQIQYCIFIQNEAKAEGGAIFYQNNIQHLKINQVYFSLNQAQIGGAIYDFNIYNDTSASFYLIGNKATQYGNNIATQASILQLLVNDIPQITKANFVNNQTIEEVLFLNNKRLKQQLYFPSGQNIKEYEIFDENNASFKKIQQDISINTYNFLAEQMIEQNNTMCYLNSQPIKQIGNDTYNINESVSSQILYDDTKLQYSFNQLSFTLDPYLESSYQLRNDVQCDSVNQKNYYLRFYSKSYKCQIGEYYQDGQCLKCNSNQGYYSVEPKAISCQRINIQMINSTTGALIQLKAGFWRPTFRSNKIEYCKTFPLRCIGGWQVSDKSCSRGTIGALCEQCDIYNIRGDGSFLNSKSQNCWECGKLSYQLVFMIFETIWVMLLIFLTIKSNDFQNKQFFRLKCIYRHFGTIQKQMLDQTSTLIKLGNNNFQILSLIETFQISKFSYFTNFVIFLGDSTYMVTYQLDCSIPYIMHINYEYAHYIFILLLPLFHFALGCAILMIFVSRKQIVFSKSQIFCAIIYLYCLNQQNIVKWGVSLVTKRQISGIDWIQANIENKFNTQIHLNWSIRFIYPILIFIGILIPIFLYLQLKKRKDRLNDKNPRLKYSFLYNEYNEKSYYWEIIKMIYKLSIILIANYYEQYILVKGVIIFLIILIYYKFCQQIQPYKLQSISKIDVKTTFLLSIIMLMGLLLYIIQQENIIYLDYMVQIIIIFFMLALTKVLMYRILLVNIAKLDLQFDFVRKIIIRRFPSIPQQLTFLKPYLLLRKIQEERIQTRFLKINLRYNKQVAFNVQKLSMINQKPFPQNIQPFMNTDKHSKAQCQNE